MKLWGQDIQCSSSLEIPSKISFSLDRCVIIAIYLIDRIHTPHLTNESPYELFFFLSKPSYSHIKSFECLCYASTISENSSKFDS